MIVIVPGAEDTARTIVLRRRCWLRSPRRCCRSTAVIAISATRRRCTARSRRGGPTWSRRRRPGRARRWSARWPGIGAALARHACRSAVGLCLSLVRAASRRSRRSTAGSTGSGSICARLDGAFDLVVSASADLTRRLAAGGLRKSVTIPMGVEPGRFSPALRDPRRCARTMLRALRPDPSATLLLIGVGRYSPEKRWDMVIDAALAAGVVDSGRPGAGRRRAQQAYVVAQAAGGPHVVDRRCRRAIALRWPPSWRAPTRSSTAARRRPSAWSRPKRAPAGCR